MGPTQILIRAREAADFPALVRVMKEVYATNGYISVWPKDTTGWLTPDGALAAWVAIDGQRGEVLGHIGVVRSAENSNTAWVTRLFVSPSVRGRRLGIGEKMLKHLRGWAVERGLFLYLEVLEDSEPAISLYERTGWIFLRSEPARWVDGRGIHPLVKIFEAPKYL